MRFRPMFLLDAGESKELVPLKLLFVIHFFAFSVQTYLPVSAIRLRQCWQMHID